MQPGCVCADMSSGYKHTAELPGFPLPTSGDVCAESLQVLNSLLCLRGMADRCVFGCSGSSSDAIRIWMMLNAFLALFLVFPGKEA